MTDLDRPSEVVVPGRGGSYLIQSPSDVTSLRQSRLVYAIMGIVGASLGARGLTLPLYADQLGATPAEVGLLFSAWVATTAIVSVPAGVLIDRVGPKRMLLVSLAAFAICQVGAGLTTSVPALFLTQPIGGIGLAASQTALLVCLAAAVPPVRFGQAMGWFTFAMFSGQLTGPGIGGALLQWLSLPQVFFLSGVPVVLAAVWVLVALKPVRASPSLISEVGRSLVAVARLPGSGPVALALLAVGILFGTYLSYIAIFARRDLDLTGTEIGYFLALSSVVSAVSPVLAGRLIDRLGPTSVAVIISGATAIYGVGLVLLPHVTSFLDITLLLIVISPFIATAQTATAVAFMQIAPRRSRGSLMGIYSMLNSIGFVAGAVGLAPLMNQSYAVGFTTCGVTGIALALLSLLGRMRTAKPRPRVEATSPERF